MPMVGLEHGPNWWQAVTLTNRLTGDINECLMIIVIIIDNDKLLNYRQRYATYQGCRCQRWSRRCVSTWRPSKWWSTTRSSVVERVSTSTSFCVPTASEPNCSSFCSTSRRAKIIGYHCLVSNSTHFSAWEAWTVSMFRVSVFFISLNIDSLLSYSIFQQILINISFSSFIQ